MSELPEIIEMGPEEEAQRLWRGAVEARESAADDLVSLCESLDLGIRAAEIMVVQKLQPIKEDFPATIGILLEVPSPEVDTYQDAINVPNSLGFTDIVDLLGKRGHMFTSKFPSRSVAGLLTVLHRNGQVARTPKGNPRTYHYRAVVNEAPKSVPAFGGTEEPSGVEARG